MGASEVSQMRCDTSTRAVSASGPGIYWASIDAGGSARKTVRRVLSLYALWCSGGFVVLNGLVIYYAVRESLGMWALPLLALYALLFWSIYRVITRRGIDSPKQHQSEDSR